jgi:hypothetical protein
VFELLDSEEEVLVGLAVRQTRATKALLNGGIDEAAGAGRALACPAQDVLDRSATFLTLYPTLLYQTVHRLLNPFAGDGSGAYL